MPAKCGSRGPRPSDLIEAKLLVPRSVVGSVPRNRVLRRLKAGSDRQLVSIVAPPGYGKTTLLAQWATDGPRQAAWLTIDALDNDAVVFLGYLAAALDRIEALDSSVFRAIGSRASGHALCHRPPPVCHVRLRGPGPGGSR